MPRPPVGCSGLSGDPQRLDPPHFILDRDFRIPEVYGTLQMAGWLDVATAPFLAISGVCWIIIVCNVAQAQRSFFEARSAGEAAGTAAARPPAA